MLKGDGSLGTHFMALGKTTAFQTRAFAIMLVVMAGSVTCGPASAQVYWGDRPSGGWGWDNRPSGGWGDRFPGWGDRYPSVRFVAGDLDPMSKRREEREHHYAIASRRKMKSLQLFIQKFPVALVHFCNLLAAKCQYQT